MKASLFSLGNEGGRLSIFVSPGIDSEPIITGGIAENTFCSFRLIIEAVKSNKSEKRIEVNPLVNKDFEFDKRLMILTKLMSNVGQKESILNKIDNRVLIHYIYSPLF